MKVFHAIDVLQEMTFKKVIGYVLVVFSFVVWVAILTLPLFDISLGEGAALTTALIVAGEASFFVGIALLGKEAWAKLKAIFKRRKRD